MPLTFFCRGSLLSWRLASVVGLVLVSLSVLAQAPARQPVFNCGDGLSYLFQGNTTDAFEIDLFAGSINQVTTGGLLKDTTVVSGKLNAFGYNPLDSLIYGYVFKSNKLVRIGKDYSTQLFTVTGLNSGANYVVGDIDQYGQMYLTAGGTTGANTAQFNIRTIDLSKAKSTTTLTYTLLNTDGGAVIQDWTVSPKDNNLYAIDSRPKSSSEALVLYRFRITRDQNNIPTQMTREILGTVSGGSPAIAPDTYGAVFMDLNGSMYIVANSTGRTYRIQRPDYYAASTEATLIPTTYIITAPVAANGNNDGARCAFSRIISNTVPPPLPVTLVSFTATAAPSRRVQLNWATASELNSSYFEVQHSVDGNAFTAIGQVKGKGTTSLPSSYSFVDVAPGAAATHYYRLRQVDQDGRSAFGSVQVVTLAPGTSAVQLTSLPNPTTGDNLSLQVQYDGAAATPVVLAVHGLLGQVVCTQALVLGPGTTALALPTRLAPGVYVASLRGNGSFASQSTKILVTN